jgi:uncharacterized protein
MRYIMEREVRVTSDLWPDADMEIRAKPDGLNFRGYAAVFDSPSEDLGGFREIIRPGSFRSSIARRKRPMKMFLTHDERIVLAANFRTMRLKEDDHGLLVDADLPDNEWGRPVRDAIVRGDIDSMSFAFNLVQGGERWSEDRSERELTDLYAWEVSPVTSWPAYLETSASVRTLAEMVEVEPDVLLATLRDFFAVEHAPTPETRRLMRSLLDAREPEPEVDPIELDYIRARLARRAALDSFIPAPDPAPDPDPDPQAAPVEGTTPAAPRTPTNDPKEDTTSV